MSKKDQQFYLVREDVLPEAMQKTLQAKRLIERGKADSIADAVQMVAAEVQVGAAKGHTPNVILAFAVLGLSQVADNSPGTVGRIDPE